PKPDFAIVPGRPRDYAVHPTTADLVIEVADSSLDFDTYEKRLLYARASIREYWVVDINGRRLLVYRDPQAGVYATQLTLGPSDPVQEEALLAWFTSDQGVLVCAPTGTGKTLIAQAALFETLHTGGIAYYTIPLIALTVQKFREMQESAIRWGFSPDEVGLVT